MTVDPALALIPFLTSQGKPGRGGNGKPKPNIADQFAVFLVCKLVKAVFNPGMSLAGNFRRILFTTFESNRQKRMKIAFSETDSRWLGCRKLERMKQKVAVPQVAVPRTLEGRNGLTFPDLPSRL